MSPTFQQLSNWGIEGIVRNDPSFTHQWLLKRYKYVYSHHLQGILSFLLKNLSHFVQIKQKEYIVVFRISN
jgi:hypothetical protein